MYKISVPKIYVNRNRNHWRGKIQNCNNWVKNTRVHIFLMKNIFIEFQNTLMQGSSNFVNNTDADLYYCETIFFIQSLIIHSKKWFVLACKEALVSLCEYRAGLF